MACFVQILTYTTVYSKIKDKKIKKIKTFPYLPTYLETEGYIGNNHFFSRPYYHTNKRTDWLVRTLSYDDKQLDIRPKIICFLAPTHYVIP